MMNHSTASTKKGAWSLVALCLGFFMVIIDVNIVNIALPTMANSLDGDISWLQWVVDGYSLTFAALLLSSGNLADKIGAKTTYLIGLIVFVLTSLACGLASSFTVLTLFRILQGIAAALLVPTALALINASYETKEERAKAIGIWASLGGFAGATSPVLGSVLTAAFGWRAVFLINIPIGIIGILLTLKYVKKIPGFRDGGFDFIGQITAITWIGALAFSLIEAGRLGWNSKTILISFTVFFIAFIIFIINELKEKSPLLPLQFFRSKTFSTAIFTGLILNLSFYGILFLLPLYFQNVKSYSVLTTGLAITPLSALAAVCAYYSGRLIHVSGIKMIMMTGLLVASSGFFMLLMSNASTPYYFLLLPLLLIGGGASLTMPAATVATINSIPENRAGLATGAFNTSRQVGNLVGVALFGTLVNTSSSFINGLHSSLLISGLLFILGSLAAFLWVEI